METVLEITGASKHFKAVKAVDGLSLALPQGCVFGFLGQNGAGKTTTLRMITGLARPTAGEITICGSRVAFGSGRTNKHVGYLPDIPRFYDWMKPEEFLVLCGRLQGLNTADAAKKAKELLGSTGLAGVGRTIKGFSRGMKQRLGIAQALMNNPPLLLMDEPTSALDPLGRKEVLDIIKGLGGRHTVLFSTHILSDAERICDRVGILHHGKLALDGTLQEICSRYPTKGAALEIPDKARHGELLHRLQGMPWVTGVSSDAPGSFNIRTMDLARMDSELCPLLAAMDMPIRRYDHLESTLEEVFVEVIGK